MKNLLLITLLLSFFTSFSQDVQDSTRSDTPRRAAPAPVNRVRRPAVKPLITTSRPDILKLDSSLRMTDTLAVDTFLSSLPVKDTVVLTIKYIPGSDSARFLNPYYFRYLNPVRYTITQRLWEGKEEVFYSVIGLLLLFALLRNSFRRYVNDLFKTYFRINVSHRQIKEQVVQNSLPSLLFNIFFALSAGLFLGLIFHHYNWAREVNVLLLSAYCALGLAAIYTIKFLTLKFLGWILQASEPANTYIFIVFTTNKIIGIVVLPFLVVLAFTYGNIYLAAISLSLFVVIALFLYRYFLSYVSINRSLRINFLHFLLYLAAFEVVPLLLINKLLFILLDQLY